MWENIFPRVEKPCGMMHVVGVEFESDKTAPPQLLAADTGFPTIYHVHVQWIENSGPGTAVRPFPSITSRGPSHRKAPAAPMLIVEAYFFKAFFFFCHFTSPRNSSSLFTLSSWMAFVLNWLTGFEYLHSYSREHSVCLHALVPRSQVLVSTTGIDREWDWKAR